MITEDTIEDVIRQFTDPMAFLRELVQNALDAGSSEVEIEFSYDASRAHGLISVVDWGEGMTREIIETRLVRLFNSTKDDDLTKIGKFGIGFVSVFAMQPSIVCVDTGRDGEYWRVLLHPDRTYELLRLEHPVEGTRVDLHVAMAADAFDEVRAEAHTKVARWCEFAPVPVLIDGEDIRGTWALDGFVVATFEEEGTRAIAALTHQPGVGKFFNGGLALQSIPSEWPNVSYMIDSRYLEHTLTRDQVLQNKNFHAAIQRLRRLIEHDLVEAALKTLHDHCVHGRSRDWSLLAGQMSKVYSEDILRRTHTPTIHGEALTAGQVRAARDRNRLLLTHGKSALTAKMPSDYVLLDVSPSSDAFRLVTRHAGRTVPVLERVWMYIEPQTIDTPSATALLEELTAALRFAGSSPTWIGYGNFSYRGSGLEARGLVVVPDRTQAIHLGDAPTFDFRRTTGDVLLNPKHPIVADAIKVAATEPEWAGYTLLKCAALAAEAVEQGHLDQTTDANLALEMLRRRDARRGTAPQGPSAPTKGAAR